MLLAAFPPLSPPASGVPSLSARAMGRLLIVLHPELLHALFRAWALLSERFKESGLGPLTTPLTTEGIDKAGTAAEDTAGLLGYTVHSISRTGKHTACVVFANLGVADEVTLDIPAGDGPFWQFLLEETPDFLLSARFVGLLMTCL